MLMYWCLGVVRLLVYMLNYKKRSYVCCVYCMRILSLLFHYHNGIHLLYIFWNYLYRHHMILLNADQWDNLYLDNHLMYYYLDHDTSHVVCLLIILHHLDYGIYYMVYFFLWYYHLDLYNYYFL